MLSYSAFRGWVLQTAHIVILFVGVLALAPSAAIGASSVTLEWAPSPGTNIAGYKIYYGIASHTYTNTVDVGNLTNLVVGNLVSGATYFFAATAYDTSSLESDYSTEVAYTNVASASPTIVLNSPVNGAIYTNPATITLAAGVIAKGHTISNVQFYNGASLLGGAASAPYSFLWTNVSAGSYSLTAQALYDSGSTVSSAPAIVTVTSAKPVDNPPTISFIANQTISTNRAQLTLPFIINGAGTAVSNLSVYATSTNLTLLPTTNILIFGSDTNCTVTLLPMLGQTGEVDITISVSNLVSSLTADTTFHLSIVERVDWNLWWKHDDGYTALWVMDGTNATTRTRLNAVRAAKGWSLAGTGDFDGDGQTDLLWQSTSGWVALWLMDGTNLMRTLHVNSAPVASGWRIGGTGDFDGDGHTDILWQSDTGWVALWLMDRTNLVRSLHVNSAPIDQGWKILGTGDFDGDGHTDILWQSTSGWVALWLMDGIHLIRTLHVNSAPVAPGWTIVGTADIFDTGHIDILWRQEQGTIAYWEMDGTNVIQAGRLNPAWAEPIWRIVGPK